MNLIVRSAGDGIADILADGQLVGRAVRAWKQDELKCMVPAYDAELWVKADEADPEVTGRASRPTLRELRAELQRRLTEEGPWWSCAFFSTL